MGGRDVFLLPHGQSECNKLENTLHWHRFSIFHTFFQSLALFVLRLNRWQALRQHVPFCMALKLFKISSHSQTKFIGLLPVQRAISLMCFSVFQDIFRRAHDVFRTLA